ncbi:RNA polymerase sigma factor SigZ [Shewanella submarina]|uniref:RNA polymerase sigma factor SigZ n=1 Tax=Shewanella submarina TaxID=2016376 RepID=A0ABV7GJS2_9GAMM|nr:RNA polymerase sigma factor SigZ [Shewanella submarina]MCL1036215.1 RNA polymerase sigma factor SigZ [Shewanella submarina]
MEHHWQLHKAKLRSYLARHLNHDADTDDILQEVYIKAHTQWHTLKSQTSLSAWLHRIAYNNLMDHFRQSKPWDELPDSLESAVADETEMAHQQLSECLRPLMEELPEKYRVPLEKADLDGKNQQQVADELGLSLSGAKSRVQRGRVLLKEKFTACCDIEVGRGGVTSFSPKKPGSQRC